MKSARSLVAHLMRRAGFGATPAELDVLTSEKTYEEIVDDLIHPDRFPALDTSYIDRYYGGELVAIHVGKWLYRMVNTQRPLEEKMALFLHHIFPVAWGKSEHGPSIYTEIDMFRHVGLTNMKTILLELSRDPAMIFWLDNNENHKDEINENYGRELLELFSMGVGNYTEDDIKSASRAFTGWTFRQPLSLYPVGHHPAEFEFLDDDHDDGPKTFLGQTGNFNGDDIIDIIVQQPATARFISRHLYNFFVEDELQVPSWATEPPKNPAAIDHLSQVFMDTEGDMRAVLGALFNSDFFKEAVNLRKVKSPTELIAGVLKQTGEFREPAPGLHEFGITTLNGSTYEGPMAIMGQRLLNPPTVEGWHTGHEWIDSGTLSERVGFAERQFADRSKPGIQDILSRAGSLDGESSQIVDRCLDVMGAIRVSEKTREALVAYTDDLKRMQRENGEETAGIHNLLQMIASTVDYQFV
ncbi:DUF1800 domain-containing protein [Candidatus Entotheonella palauensis]|uniref:DUF1800 domain-containing protein n=1 Tax=Candidatus Entotheonella gemina TaxID=1429439 RepID=W4ME96_9BACT|nr:DUF1800 domain-containing protein [Candidatus Entotheonella palauensis]ETX08505.1 MAG: hypothetical protein ETSY2_05015 [Candidatus Entotheonella gemina]